MKKWLAVLMCCVLLCTSALAEFEDAFPAESDTEVNSDEETAAFPEMVDEVVSSVSDLVDTAISPDSVSELPAEVSPGGNTIYVLTSPPASDDADDVSTDEPAEPVDMVLSDVSVYSVAPITPSDATGLKAALLGILGSYDPVIVEYQYSSSQGYNNYLREIQPDYVWLCSCALLALMIFCLFKLGGALLRG